ncbi:hypothetical protein [Desulfuromonas sp. CSMB_57]|jgi:hypothetical protein|uniref:hypothetical protein n=1 Tax=Desulfuromonas sp. CSMB_57 TaxID=2807629 RepID=UPI001CD6F163|nr:hypothetical protein [Desulfuromonas sp. CSMB_57]
MNRKQFVVKMAPNTPLTVHSSCKTCGGESEGVGYLAGSDADGNGFVLWIDEEDVYQAIRKVLGQAEG